MFKVRVWYAHYIAIVSGDVRAVHHDPSEGCDMW